MQPPRGRRLAAVLVAAIAVYGAVAVWALNRFRLPPIRPFGLLLLAAAVALQFVSIWLFGAMFREGAEEAGRRIAPGSAFRAALVGSGVVRLIPVGGAIVPVAMAWSVRREAGGTAGAAVRAAGLNYAGLLVGTGLSLVWIRGRGLAPAVEGGLIAVGTITAAIGLVVMFGSGRLGALSRVLPTRLRRKVEHTLVNHGVGWRTQLLLWGRLLSEAAALWAVMEAFAIHLTPTQTFAAFGATQLFGGLPGTPGGLGLAEAGLVGALAAFGYAASTTVGVALIYRVISYWVPAGAGLVAGGLSFLRRQMSDEASTSSGE